MPDCIQIKELDLPTRIGVGPEERALPQSVSVNVAILLDHSLHGIEDDLGGTVDYFEVSQSLRRIAAEGERKLIETLAEDLAEAVLAFPGVAEVEVEVEKFILPHCGSVSVTITRPSPD